MSKTITISCKELKELLGIENEENKYEHIQSTLIKIELESIFIEKGTE